MFEKPFYKGTSYTTSAVLLNGSKSLIGSIAFVATYILFGSKLLFHFFYYSIWLLCLIFGLERLNVITKIVFPSLKFSTSKLEPLY